MRTLRNLLLTLYFGLMSVSAWAGDVVSLLDSTNVTSYRYGTLAQFVQVRILVKNLCYEKDVRVVLENAKRQVQTLQARYVGPAHAGYEIWEAAAYTDPADYKLKAVAQLEEQTYEDQAVALPVNSGPRIYGDRVLTQMFTPESATPGSRVPITAVVKDIGSQRKVYAHFSVDGWKTIQVLPLHYQSEYAEYGDARIPSPSANGYSLWSLEISVPPTTRELSYYLSYEVDGTVYQDMNFGHYYRLELH